MGHRRARTTGAHLHHALTWHIIKVAPETFGEPQAIGVVADAFAVFEHHRIHRADTPCFIGQFIEQR